MSVYTVVNAECHCYITSLSLSNRAIPKCLREIAQESKLTQSAWLRSFYSLSCSVLVRITEGLRDGDADAWRRTVSACELSGGSVYCVCHLQALLLPGYPFNHGALLAAAHLLSGSDPTLHIAVGRRQLHTHNVAQIINYHSFSLLS